MSRILAALILAMVLAAPAHAVLPGEQLDDPALEARARDISRELRCQVCQNQSIDDSNAPLAADLRRLVRERIKAGDTDAEVFAYLTQRYGDYVLLRPPVRDDTLILWYGPAAILLLAIAGLGVHLYRRRREAAESAPLAADEEQRLARLMDDQNSA